MLFPPSLLCTAATAAAHLLSPAAVAPPLWTLRLSIGREVSIFMPEEWGLSGKRLPLRLDVAVSSEASPAHCRRVGSSCSLLPCSSDVCVRGFDGEANFPVSAGGWRREGSSLQFWLEFPDGVTRGGAGPAWPQAESPDVHLPAGRLFFEGAIEAAEGGQGGSWPGAEPAAVRIRPGALLVKRVGPFGELAFGFGHHYTSVGTWSAEPVSPVAAQPQAQSGARRAPVEPSPLIQQRVQALLRDPSSATLFDVLHCPMRASREAQKTVALLGVGSALGYVYLTANSVQSPLTGALFVEGWAVEAALLLVLLTRAVNGG
jgi:hypothetical protein